MRSFVRELRQADRRAPVVVLGDLNDFQFAPTLDRPTEAHTLDHVSCVAEGGAR